MDSRERIYAFEGFELDAERLELRKDGEPVEIHATPLRLLAYLAENHDRTVSKQELLDRVWADAFVGEAALTTAVKEARQALGDSGQEPRLIKTQRGRGYRFAGKVLEVSQQTSRRSGHRIWVHAFTAGILTAIVGLGWWVTRPPPDSQSNAAPIRSIAVLPFENLSGDPEQDYFADGMTAVMTGELGKLGALRVVSYASSRRYGGTEKSLPEVSAELGVEGLLTGSVIRDGASVRVAVQLIDGRTDAHIWSTDYNLGLSHVLSLYREVAREVAQKIQLATPSGKWDGRSSVGQASIDPRAFDAYVRGLRILSSEPMLNIRVWGPEVIGYFQQAVDFDPGFGDAWSALARWRAYFASYAPASERDQINLAEAAAIRALELDERHAGAHVALGWVRRLRDWDPVSAHEASERALSLAPSEVPAITGMSKSLIRSGRVEEGLAMSGRLELVDPLSAFTRGIHVANYYEARRHERAVFEFERLRELDPEYPPDDYHAGALEALGRFAESLEIWRAIFERCGSTCDFQRDALDRFGVTEQRVRALIEGFRARGDLPFVVAMLYAKLGEVDQALESLEQAYVERAPALGDVLHILPDFDHLRVDSRFNRFLRRIGSPTLEEEPGVRAETGRVLALGGRSLESVAHIEKAMADNPEDSRLPRWHYYMSLAYFAAEDYGEAAGWAQRSLDLDPGPFTLVDAKLILAASYANLGRIGASEEALRGALTGWPNLTPNLVPLPLYTDQGLRERYVHGLTLAGFEP